MIDHAPAALPASARAAVATDAYTTVPRDLPLPEVGPDDGLLQVEAVGLCGTDWEFYGRATRGGGLGPMVLGHETVGRVAALGERAADRWGVAAGDRVAVEEFLPCDACRLCRGGEYRLCAATDSRGSRQFLRYGCTPLDVPPGLYGGFAEYLYLHPRAIVYRVGEDVPPGLATLFVPVSNGIRWVTQEAGLTLGETLVVQGAGQHGLGCVVAARESGAGTVIAVDVAAGARRLEVAKTLGADHVLAADEVDIAEAVLDITGGVGADVVVDLVPGTTRTIATGLAMAGARGRVVLAASKHPAPSGTDDTSFLNETVVRKELRVLGVRGHDHRSVEPALALITSGRYPLETLCTHEFPLDRVHEGLRAAFGGGDRTIIHATVVP